MIRKTQFLVLQCQVSLGHYTRYDTHIIGTGKEVACIVGLASYDTTEPAHAVPVGPGVSSSSLGF